MDQQHQLLPVVSDLFYFQVLHQLLWCRRLLSLVVLHILRIFCLESRLFLSVYFGNNYILLHYVTDRNQIESYVQNGRLRLPNNVNVVAVKALAKPAVDIYGGLALSTCTSGFACKKSDGTKGITTAAHCDNSQWYTIFPLSFQQENLGTYYDIQWHTTPLLTVKNKIRVSSSGTTRDVTGTKSRSEQAIGEWVEKYGKTTGYTAGYIASKTVFLSYIPNCQLTFIRVDNTAGYSPLVSGGDSGGPWFRGNTAYGTTCAYDDTGDGYYMAIDYVTGIGVTIMTSP
jgi:hypothetical protein